MDHPNTAKVLDSGSTATGRPYGAVDLKKWRTLPAANACRDERKTPAAWTEPEAMRNRRHVAIAVGNEVRTQTAETGEGSVTGE